MLGLPACYYLIAKYQLVYVFCVYKYVYLASCYCFFFAGDCRYVLAEDDCGTGSSSFKIIVENVPCGAGGAACTKAIKFSIQGFDIQMVGGAETSVQNSGGAEIDPRTIFQIRSVGIYEVIETTLGELDK